jgi:murein DD-endopeptidase MepM/ murein hydrolase activator NlpD
MPPVRPVVRRALAAAASLPLLLLVPASSAAGDSLDDAQARVDAARDAANEASQRYEEANARYYELDAEIARTRAALETATTEAERIRALARERAVEAYKGKGLDLGSIVAGDDVLDAVRRTELLDRVNARGNDAVDLLGAIEEDLDARERALAASIDAQQDVVEERRAREGELRDALDTATRAYEELRDRLAREREAAERAAAARRAAVSSAGAGRIIASGEWVCPVQGAVAFSDTWGAPRSGGRRHQGVDMMAASGTPVVAVVGGSISQSSGGLGGNAIWLHGNDGNTYYYAHLRDFTGGSRSVSAGEQIGTVGDTGNARGGPPHLHFEIHPGGGAAINPTPTVSAYC